MVAGKKNVMKGCIKTSKMPWLVSRTKKDGTIVTSFRYPSNIEREKKKQRARQRRSVVAKIFAGLRAHGNYKLPKHAHTNDLLMALCEEAGWHVEEDGTIHKKIHKEKISEGTHTISNHELISHQHVGEHVDHAEGYCTCNNHMYGQVVPSTNFNSPPSRCCIELTKESNERSEHNLTLSLTLGCCIKLPKESSARSYHNLTLW